MQCFIILTVAHIILALYDIRLLLVIWKERNRAVADDT